MNNFLGHIVCNFSCPYRNGAWAYYVCENELNNNNKIREKESRYHISYIIHYVHIRVGLTPQKLSIADAIDV